MIANTSAAIAIAPASTSAASASVSLQRRDVLARLAAFIQRVADSPRVADDSERYWTTVGRGL